MKKKIFGAIAVLAIATAVIFNVNLNIDNENVSLLSLANIEALAQSENDNRNRVEKEITTNWQTTEVIDGTSMQCNHSQIKCEGTGNTLCFPSYSKNCFGYN